jgi:hypothetical protein
MSESQNTDDLEIYLRDHYAGAISALELLEHLIEVHADDSLGGFFSQLHAEIKADHEQLHNLMQALGFKDGTLRNAGAWVAEKMSRAKIGFAFGEDAKLRLLQALETLVIGITGKKLLWEALIAVKERSPVLRRTDLTLLQARAVQQIEQAEARRIEAARAVFAT